MAEAECKRQIKIKTGVVKRTIKEYGMYIQEKADMEAKVEAMKADASYDEYDVRKQEDVLGETVMMIPDTRGRLERGVEDLQALLDDEEAVALGEVEEVASAKAILTESEAVLTDAASA